MSTGAQEHLKGMFSGAGNGRAVGENDHVFSGRCVTGGQKLAAALHFNHTYPASARGCAARQVAEGGDFYLIFPGHFQNGLPGLKWQLIVVYYQGRHRVLLSTIFLYTCPYRGM